MMESGRYAPPALSTLRGYGILDDGESCGDSCPIDLHSTGPDTESDGERSGGERDWGGIEARRLKYDWKVGETPSHHDGHEMWNHGSGVTTTTVSETKSSD